MTDIETYRYGKNGGKKIRVYLRKAYKKARYKKRAKRAFFYEILPPSWNKGR